MLVVEKTFAFLRSTFRPKLFLLFLHQFFSCTRYQFHYYTTYMSVFMGVSRVTQNSLLPSLGFRKITNKFIALHVIADCFSLPLILSFFYSFLSSLYFQSFLSLSCYLLCPFHPSFFLSTQFSYVSNFFSFYSAFSLDL